MIFNFYKRLCCLVLLLLLTACSSHMQPPAKLAELSRGEFKNALRWKQYEVAAGLMLPEHRKAFMKTFSALKDIHIVDVKFTDVQPAKDNQGFETTIEMEYYLLPSVTVKTFSLDQTWVYFEGEDPTHQGFFIATPFPAFP